MSAKTTAAGDADRRGRGRTARLLPAAAAALLAAGACTTEETPQSERNYFTSGNREADQRAEQRMARDRQIRGDGENTPLYDRLGGEKGLQAIADDFIRRVLADPRVNWERKGVASGWVFRRGQEWKPADENVARLKKHLVQFLATATGGPPKYEGRDLAKVHEDLKITNAEFDASVGDLKATLDGLGVATEKQKELLAVVESTRTQVVTVR